VSPTTYRIRAKALDDLERIWMYTAKKWSVEQADNYYNRIIDEIDFLTTHANSGKPIGHVKPGYRSYLVKSHIIFYKKVDNNRIEIVRILHQRMDVKTHLRN